MALANQQDALPTVNGTSDRDLRFPNPATDFKVYDKQTGQQQRWNGTTWIADGAMARGATGVWDSALYGATGDGTTDDTSAIQAALTACAAAGGGKVLLPKGVARITSALTLGDDVWLVGNGRQGSRIVQATTTADGVVLSGQRARFSDCAVDYASAAASGTYATKILNAGRCRVDDIVWGFNCARFLGVLATAGASSEDTVRVHVRRCSSAGIATEYGVVLAGGSATRRVLDCHLDNVWVSATTDAFRIEDWVQGPRLSGCIADFSGRGFHITPSASGRTFDVFLLHAIADAITTDENIRAKNCYSVYIEYPWMGAVPAGKYGIHLEDTVYRSFINGGRISHKESGSAGLGCVFVDADTTQVRNVSFLQGAVAPTNAAVVIGTNATYVTVTGNQFEGFAVGKDVIDNSAGSTCMLGPNYDDAYGPEARFGSRVNTTAHYRVSGTQVVGARVTGWDAPTGTQTRGTFDVATATTASTAQALAALIADLRTHGLLGT